MFRSLVMFPAEVTTADVDRIRDEEIVPAFSLVPGFLGVTSSRGPLMGPSAKTGRIGSIITVDFETLDAALEAIQSPAFAKGTPRPRPWGSRSTCSRQPRTDCLSGSELS